MTFPKHRIPYSAIIDRPPLALPNGARMVVWIIVNVEEWDIERAMPRTVLTPPNGAAPTAGLAKLGMARVRNASWFLAPS